MKVRHAINAICIPIGIPQKKVWAVIEGLDDSNELAPFECLMVRSGLHSITIKPISIEGGDYLLLDPIMLCRNEDDPKYFQYDPNSGYLLFPSETAARESKQLWSKGDQLVEALSNDVLRHNLTSSDINEIANILGITLQVY